MADCFMNLVQLIELGRIQFRKRFSCCTTIDASFVEQIFDCSIKIHTQKYFNHPIYFYLIFLCGFQITFSKGLINFAEFRRHQVVGATYTAITTHTETCNQHFIRTVENN